MADEQWLEYRGKNRRIAQRIRHKPNEREAMIRHGVALLIVIGKVPYPVLANNFTAILSKIEAFLFRHEPPFIAKIYRPLPAELVRYPRARGDVSLWY